MANSSAQLSSLPLKARLTQSLSTLETWGFGVVTHIACPIVVPAVHAALGSQAIFVWVPAVIIGMLVNYQIKQLGLRYIDLAGGTSSYSTRLWQNYPLISRYLALAFFSAWLAAVPVYAIVMADLIQENLTLLGLSCPDLLLRVSFILLPFVLTFSGTRATSLLHLCFIIPALGLLLLFCVEGLGWLALAPNSPGFFPERLTPPGFFDWAKWFFLVVWVTYSGESAAAFVADSKNPKGTLKFLAISAWLLVPVYIGGAWIVMRLATDPGLAGDPFQTFLAAAQPFWGNAATIVVTFWLAAICLLNNATVVSICPRMLYQLALDHHLSPIFGIVSRRGVFGAALVLMVILSMVGLAWGDVPRLLVFGNVTWFVGMMLLHLGLWLQRQRPEVLWPRLSLGFFGLEAVVFVTAAIAWGWQNFLLGLLPPVVIMGIDAAIRRIHLPIFQSGWWIRRYQPRPAKVLNDSVIVQVVNLIVLLSGAVLAGWWFGTRLNDSQHHGDNLVAILLITVVFVGVAIACWTSLPQVTAIAEAREATEHLFMVAQDGIVVVNAAGVIQKANPAIGKLLGQLPGWLVGNPIQNWFPELSDSPEEWPQRSEQSLAQPQQTRTLEISISDHPHHNFQEYIVILRDITERKQAEQVLQQSEAEMRLQAQQLAAQLVQSEKLSSLGQLVAGIAHEINNPVGFIYGNLSHAEEYTLDLLELIQLYQQHYPEPVPEIDRKSREVDLEFLAKDLPKLIDSMQLGAERIQRIVLSLQNFSRKDEAEIKFVDIHEGIESTLMILHQRLKFQTHRSDIQVIKQYGELPTVECYVGQLNQVIMNIVVNAIDSIDERVEADTEEFIPAIRIQTQWLEADWIRIRISDNGIGISEAVGQRLFDPFFTTKPVGKGTGLGLSLSHDIITKKHGGRLYWESVVGQGAIFTLEIPCHQQVQAARPQS